MNFLFDFSPEGVCEAIWHNHGFLQEILINANRRDTVIGSGRRVNRFGYSATVENGLINCNNAEFPCEEWPRDLMDEFMRGVERIILSEGIVDDGGWINWSPLRERLSSVVDEYNSGVIKKAVPI